MNEANEIRERIVNGFAINRIPPKDKKWFIDFAKSDFCDDRGMALKHLCDTYRGIISTGMEHLEIAINELANDVELLKQQAKKEEPKVSRMLDGKEMKKGS